jgi:L-iditol 2-dehydrogenase
MPYLNKGMQKYPFIPGHEWSGEIIEIGKNTKNFKIGDRVTGDVAYRVW